MFRIASQIIQMNRGDDVSFHFDMNVGSHLHPIQGILQDDEAIYFAVMEPNQKWEEAIIRKKYTNENLDCRGNVQINIKSEETEHLHPGLYYYQIKGLLKQIIGTEYKPEETEYTFYRNIESFPIPSFEYIDKPILLYNYNEDYGRVELIKYTCLPDNGNYGWVKGKIYPNVINSKDEYNIDDTDEYIVDDYTQENTKIKQVKAIECYQMVTNTLIPKTKFFIYE